MTGKKKTVIIAVSLGAVAVCFALISPLIAIAEVFVAAFAFGIWRGHREDAKKAGKPSAAKSLNLSASVQNDLRIVSECVNILNTSTNLRTVVSRYDVLVDALTRLSAYEGNPAVSFPHELPSVALARMSAEQPEIFNRAILRAHERVLHECAALKTENGRRNRYQKFFDELNGLLPSFPPATQAFAAQFIADNIDDPLTGLEGL